MSARQKVIKRLDDEGYEVRNLDSVAGYWKKQDVWRWQAVCIRKRNRVEVTIGSYNTLTEAAQKKRV